MVVNLNYAIAQAGKQLLNLGHNIRYTGPDDISMCHLNKGG